MKTLYGIFNKNYAKKYREHGFSRKKSVYARIKGEGIQTFTLRYSRICRSYSVEFEIIPLCMPLPVFLEGGEYNLCKIVDPFNEKEGWTFEKDSEESMQKCAEAISLAIDQFLIPFFDNCTTCKNSLPQLIRMEKTNNVNRQLFLKMKGYPDLAKPWQILSLSDEKKYYMAVKAANWPYVRRYLNVEIKKQSTILKSFDDPNSTKQPERVRERLSVSLSKLLELSDRLDSKDYGYFEAIVKTNESIMYANMKEQTPELLEGISIQEN